MAKPIQHFSVTERRGSSLLLYVPLLQGLQLRQAPLLQGELNHSLRAFREVGTVDGLQWWDKARTGEGGHRACCSSRIEGMGLLSTPCPIAPSWEPQAQGYGDSSATSSWCLSSLRPAAIVPVTGTEAVNSPWGKASWGFHILRRLGFQQPHYRGWGTQIPLESLNCSTAEQLELQRGQRNLSLLHTL